MIIKKIQLLKKINSPVPSSEKEKTKPVKKKRVQPIAKTDFFKENSLFEKQIKQNNADKNYKFQIEKPAPDGEYALKNGQLDFYLKGEIKVGNFPKGESFVLSVFDNQAVNLASENAIFSTTLPLKNMTDEEAIAFVKEEHFKVDYFQKMALKKGLYYYGIQLENDGQVVHFGKFSVL